MNEPSIPFSRLKLLCLKALRLTANYERPFLETIERINSPTIEIMVDGATPWEIEKALESLNDDKLAMFDILSRRNAVITAKGIVLTEMNDFQEKISGFQFSLDVDRSFQSDDIEAIKVSAKRVPMKIPASDRYVSVRHNQEPFDALKRSLSDIRDEFARDHNKRELLDLSGAAEFLSEVNSTLAQIEIGTVRTSQLTEALSPQVQGALLIFSAYPGIVQMIEHAIDALNLVIRNISG